MADALRIAVRCPTRGPIQLETEHWWADRDNIIHYWASCPCGREHTGFVYLGLEQEASEHEKNAQTIRASMGPRPCPDDFELLERAQREEEKAEDCRALAARLNGPASGTP
jgi:hypothetical protein